MNRRLARKFYGATTFELALKVNTFANGISEANAGIVEIFPRWYELNTGNFHQTVRVTTEHNPALFTRYADNVEKEVNSMKGKFSRFDGRIVE